MVKVKSIKKATSAPLARARRKARSYNKKKSSRNVTQNAIPTPTRRVGRVNTSIGSGDDVARFF